MLHKMEIESAKAMSTKDTFRMDFSEFYGYLVEYNTPAIAFYRLVNDVKFRKKSKGLKVCNVLANPLNLPKLQRIVIYFRQRNKSDIKVENQTKHNFQYTDCNIAIAEDSPANLNLTGATVKTAIPKKALAFAIYTKEYFVKYYQFRSELIFMDIQMLMMNGLETIRNIWIIRKTKEFKLIMMGTLMKCSINRTLERYLYIPMGKFPFKSIMSEIIEEIIKKFLLIPKPLMHSMRISHC